MRNRAAVIGAFLGVGALARALGVETTPEEVAVAAMATVAPAQESPNLGVETTPEEVAEWDIGIEPDGEGLPPGSGTAVEGASVYARYCLSCHGTEGRGQLNDVLVGGHGTLTGEAPLKTVGSFWPYATTVFDYIRRAMPYQQPQSLGDDQVYALTAYLLFLNGILEQDEALDAETLPDVRMPNRDNFILAYPSPQAE